MLSIGILTIPQRRCLLIRLLGRLQPQLTEAVEVLIVSDNNAATIGEKRNAALDAATMPYIVFIDDDDLVSPLYVPLILDALRTAPDCVGFKSRRTWDGLPWEDAIYSLRFKENSNEGATLERIPNHLTPVRIDLARQVRFPSLNKGEDTIYAEGLRPLLTSEVFIDDYLYEYLYCSPMTRSDGKVIELPPLSGKALADYLNSEAKPPQRIEVTKIYPGSDSLSPFSLFV